VACEVIKNPFPLLRVSSLNEKLKEDNEGSEKSEAKRGERDGETHMKGELDACLVIQVAGNDFTSSNLRPYVPEKAERDSFSFSGPAEGRFFIAI
jgi:hypothetical protein